MADDVEAKQRRAAIRRIKAKRWFFIHLAVFVVVNTALLVVWASTDREYFWPGWVMLGWGIGLASHAISVYGGARPISEDQIQREMGRDAGLGD